MIPKSKLIEILAQEIHKTQQKHSLASNDSWDELSYSRQLHYHCEAEMVMEVIQNTKRRIKNETKKNTTEKTEEETQSTNP